MSDFRFAGRWLNDRRVMTLSGDDFKAFVTAGTWMVENRTDGRITRDDMDFIPKFTRKSVAALTAAGLWEESGDGWQMVDYLSTQTSKAEFEVLDNARRRDREKKARQRAKHSVPGDSPGDESRGMSRRTTQAGQARQEGKEEAEAWYDENSDIDPATGEVFDSYQPEVSWPVAPIPGQCEHGHEIGAACGWPGCDGVAKARAAA